MNLDRKVIEKGDEGYEELRAEKYLPDDFEECEYCHALVNFRMLGYGEITSHDESRGEFWGAPCHERVVDGFICPNCGKHNVI